MPVPPLPPQSIGQRPGTPISNLRPPGSPTLHGYNGLTSQPPAAGGTAAAPAAAPTSQANASPYADVQAQIANNPAIQAAIQKFQAAPPGPEKRYLETLIKQELQKSGIQLPHDTYLHNSGEVRRENFFQRNPWVAPAIPFAGAAVAAPIAAGGAAAAGGAGGSAAGGSAAGGAGGGVLPSTSLATGSAGAGAGGLGIGATLPPTAGTAAAAGSTGPLGGWLPEIIKGGIGAIGGWWAGKKATESALQRSPEEQAALAGANKAGDTLMGQGQELFALGLPYMRQAGNYYQTLLRGNRAAMSQAVAQPRAAVQDVYRGAARNLEQSGVRGAQRDVAAGELGRERAGRIASLTTGVQPYAADALGNLGGRVVQAGQYGAGQAGNLYTDLLRQGWANRVYSREEGEKASGLFGDLLFDAIRSGADKAGRR